jgi:pilus assembly protein CpaB
LLKADDLGTKKVLAAEVPTGATPDSPDARRALVGGMVRRPLSAGDVILPADVMRPGDHGFLAAVLRPGMRAVTVGVDEVSGTAGLIWPGDRVDVIMTELIDDPSVPLGRRISAEAVLHGARVIAIDQELVQGASPGSPSQVTARTVTLEVTEMEAERVQVATRIGQLSLAVCSAQLASPPPLPGDQTVWAQDVSHAIAQVQVVKPQAQPTMMHVFQGSMDESDYRF